MKPLIRAVADVAAFLNAITLEGWCMILYVEAWIGAIAVGILQLTR